MKPVVPWADCEDPDELLARLGNPSRRKLRLLACAAVRQTEEARKSTNAAVLDLAERFADGRATPTELASARLSGRTMPGHPAWAVCWEQTAPALERARRAMAWALGLQGVSWYDFRRHQLIREQADLTREIFDDPDAPLVVPPHLLTWADGTIPALARGIYDERAFDRMGILGDALEDAGCEDARLVAHCRDGAGHVRGCQLIDALLGLG